MNPPPPGPELMDDVVGEILLRLPPDEPACLARASAVCKRWLRLLSDRAFLRRYRAFHGAPPLLGFLHNLDDPDHLDRFVPTAALPISPPALELHCWLALDCRHGRALLDAYPSRMELVVWYPMTGQLRRLPRPDLPYAADYTAAVLCSAAGCDHLDCLGGPFLVIVVGNTWGEETWAAVYSSDSDEWGPPTTAHLSEDPNFCADGKPAALIGDSLYFSLVLGIGILKYHMEKHSLSLIDLPVVFEEEDIVLMPLEGNVLGLAGLEDYYSLSVWSRDVSLDGVASWKKLRVIELDSLLPSLDHFRPVLLIAFVEGADIVFLRTDAGVFTIELRSMLVRKVCKAGFFNAVVPYTSFHTPGVHLQQHSRPQISWGWARRLQAANMRRGSGEQPRQHAPLHRSRQAGRPVNSQRPTGSTVRSSGHASRLPSQVRPPWRP